MLYQSQQGATRVGQKSQSRTDDICTETDSSPIRVYTSVRLNEPAKAKRNPTLRKITCFKEAEKSEFLPAILITNVRSLGPKIKHFIEELKLREITLAFLSETWGKDDNKKYRRKITSMLELQGLQTISLNRKTQRGGGVAFVYNTEYIDLEDINITVPFNLEILWRLG